MSERGAERAEGADRGGPLAGLRVLEFGEMVAAPYCAKLLGDLGADVVKIEHPAGGDSSRRRGPFQDGALDPERSGAFLYLNTSKRSLRLDLQNEQDRKTFAALADRADVLIEDRAPGELDALGLGPKTLSQRNPGLIVTSVTPASGNSPLLGTPKGERSG